MLAIVREETADEGGRGDGDRGDGNGGDASGGGGDAAIGPSLIKMLDAPESPDYTRKPAKNLKGPIIEALNELLEELSSAPTHIAEQALHTVVDTHGFYVERV